MIQTLLWLAMVISVGFGFGVRLIYGGDLDAILFFPLFALVLVHLSIQANAIPQINSMKSTYLGLLILSDVLFVLAFVFQLDLRGRGYYVVVFEFYDVFILGHQRKDLWSSQPATPEMYGVLDLVFLMLLIVTWYLLHNNDSFKKQ